MTVINRDFPDPAENKEKKPVFRSFPGAQERTCTASGSRVSLIKFMIYANIII